MLTQQKLLPPPSILKGYMMTSNGMDYYAPVLLGDTEPYCHSETEMLSVIACLWMHSNGHKNLPMYRIVQILLPAIASGQYVLGVQASKPVFYFSWANLSIEVETHYIDHSDQPLAMQDWTSGNRMWGIDWLAPFGHTYQAAKALRQQLAPHHIGRSIYHRGSQKEPRIMGWHGEKVSALDAKSHFIQNPLAANRTPTLL